MKKILVAVALITMLAAARLSPRLSAEPAKSSSHRVVFDLTSGDPQAWDAVLNNLENVHKALGPTSMQVVVHGKALPMLTATKPGPHHERMRQSAGRGVVFVACENTMKRQNVKPDELVPFAKTVDSGVAELIRKQEAGWSYVRSGP
jgi:uncharacterized protein